MNEPAWQGLRDQLADEFDEAPFMIETQVEAQNRYPGPGDGPLADAFEKGAAWALAQPPTTAETEHAARTIATSNADPADTARRIIHDLQSGRDHDPDWAAETEHAARTAYPHPDAILLWDAFGKGAAWALAQPPTTAETEHAARTIATSRHEPHWAASRVIHDLQSGRSPRHPERD